MNKQLVDLEVKIAHQEKAIQELSDTVYAQHKKIEKLDILCRHLSDKVLSLTDHNTMTDPVDEIPPHY